jgi:hypothetical protein
MIKKQKTKKQLENELAGKAQNIDNLVKQIDGLVLELFIVDEDNKLFKTVPEPILNVLRHLKSHSGRNAVNYQGDLNKFIDKFKIPYGKGLIISTDITNFRLTCIQEEVDELAYAIEAGDEAGILDALVDLIYFAFGTVKVFGFAKVFATAWARVHAANMRKVPVERASQSKRGSCYDVVKPEGWIAPDLHDLVSLEEEKIDG